MKHLQKNFEVSERRACRVLGQPRSSQRYISTKADIDTALSQRMVALSRERTRAMATGECGRFSGGGWTVNRKRVQRVWREAGLMVPSKECKRRRMGASENGITRRQAEYIDHIWSYDFAMDATEETVGG